jgi:hypothetical protein
MLLDVIVDLGRSLGGQRLDVVVDGLDAARVAVVDGLSFRHAARMPSTTAASAGPSQKLEASLG